jgi:hypothetical protein
LESPCPTWIASSAPTVRPWPPPPNVYPHAPEKWVPTAVGSGYALPEDLKPLEPYRQKLAILSGFDVKLDGVPNKPHITGCLGLRTGIPVPDESVKAPTLDVLISDAIGKNTRFRSLEISTSGIERSYSYRAAGSPNPSETSPLALYQRLFGEGFQDPNSSEFKPDPHTGLLAKALQCNQTRVFNVLLSDTTSNLRRAGSTTTHHTLTHEEPIDPQLGYQKQVAWFATQSMIAWGEFLQALNSIPEGDGTLLDHCLVLAHSDCSIAKAHAVEGIPVMIAGNAGGRIRTGIHLAGKADPITRIGLTVQQAMGLQLERWGAMSMNTNRTITELLT